MRHRSELGDSRLAGLLRPLSRWPEPLRPPVASFLVGRAIPFVGTSGVSVRRIDADGVELRLARRRLVRNHLGSVHAAAVALLAETAGGLAFAFHLPSTRTPVIKRMEITYLRRARGNLYATARVPQAGLETIRIAPSGESLIPVTVTDEAGDGLVDLQMLYAWFTRGAAA